MWCGACSFEQAAPECTNAVFLAQELNGCQRDGGVFDGLISISDLLDVAHNQVWRTPEQHVHALLHFKKSWSASIQNRCSRNRYFVHFTPVQHKELYRA